MVKPTLRNRVDCLLDYLWCQNLFQESVCLLKSTRRGKEYMFLDQRESAMAPREVIACTVMEVERRAMVDEYQSLVSEEHVGIARRAIYIRYV